MWIVFTIDLSLGNHASWPKKITNGKEKNIENLI